MHDSKMSKMQDNFLVFRL